MNLKRIILGAAVALVSVAAVAASCPIDHAAAYETGNVQFDNISGKMLYEFRCNAGHTFWSPK